MWWLVCSNRSCDLDVMGVVCNPTMKAFERLTLQKNVLAITAMTALFTSWSHWSVLTLTIWIVFSCWRLPLIIPTVWVGLVVAWLFGMPATYIVCCTSSAVMVVFLSVITCWGKYAWREKGVSISDTTEEASLPFESTAFIDLQKLSTAVKTSMNPFKESRGPTMSIFNKSPIPLYGSWIFCRGP